MGVAVVKVEAVVGAKVKAKKPSKQQQRSKEEEDNANNAATVDHPYLSFLHKRIRSYKKKLEKIRGLELARSADGKVCGVGILILMLGFFLQTFFFHD